MAKIVVVEDDVYMREELLNLLEKSGYDTIGLSDFENAVSEIAGIGQALDYVTKEEKTEDKLVSGLHCEPDTVKDIRKQTERMWENVEALLKEAGCTFDDLGQMNLKMRKRRRMYPMILQR